MPRLNSHRLPTSPSPASGPSKAGKLSERAGRSMQTAPAVLPRSVGQGVIREVKQRVLNVVTSRGQRAVQASREKTRREVGKLMRGLSSPSKNARNDFLDAKESIAGLTRTMQPMTSRGTNYEEEFRDCVCANLKDMSTEDIVKLHDSLAKPREPVLSLDPNHFVLRHFRDIQAVMAKELESRVAADSALSQMLERGMAGTIEPQQIYSSMMATAGELLTSCRQPWHDETAQRDLVLTTFARLLEKSTITEAQVDWFIAVLPSAEVNAIASHAATGFDVPSGAQQVARIAQDHLAQRREHWGSSFNAAMAQVGNPTKPDSAPQQIAQAVLAAADFFEQFQASCGPGLSPNPDLDQSVKSSSLALKAALESLLAPMNRPFSTLSGAQLRKIDAMLDKLGAAEASKNISPATGVAVSGPQPEPASRQARAARLHKGANPRLLKPLPRDNLGTAAPPKPEAPEAPPKAPAPRRVLQPGRDFNPRLLAKLPKKGSGAA